MMRVCIAAAVAAGLIGCLPPRPDIDTFTPERVAQQVETQGTEFDASVFRVGMGVRFDEGNWRLRTVTPKDPAVKPFDQLVVRVVYTAPTWRFYDRADDDRALALETVTLGRTLVTCVGSSSSGNCVYAEDVAATLPAGYLAARSDGFRVRLAMRNASAGVVVDVPANYIRGQLAATGR